MKPNVVLIGAGKFGGNHLRNLVQLDRENRINLVGVADYDRAVLGRIEKNYDIRISTDFKSFVNEADAFDIVSPASTHYSIAKFLLEQKKHIFVEKPLCLSSAKAFELVNLGRKNKSVIQVGHIFRYNKAVEYLKKDVRKKNNFPFYIKGRFVQTTEPKTDVGAIFNYLHHFDIIDEIFETKPVRVYARNNIQRNNLEANSAVFIEYKRGLNALLEFGWIPSGKHRILELYSKTQYTFCDLERQVVQIFKDNRPGKTINFDFEEPLRLELLEFLRCIRTKKSPKANSLVGYRIVKIAETATRSAKMKRQLKFDWK